MLFRKQIGSDLSLILDSDELNILETNFLDLAHKEQNPNLRIYELPDLNIEEKFCFSFGDVKPKKKQDVSFNKNIRIKTINKKLKKKGLF